MVLFTEQYKVKKMNNDDMQEDNMEFIQADTVSDVRCHENLEDGTSIEVPCPDGVLASNEKAAQRMEICKECPSYKSLMFMCKECGCIMPAKTRINNSVCPLGKW